MKNRTHLSLVRKALALSVVGAFAAFAGPAQAAFVSVFDNASYVDTSGGSGAESDTIQAVLTGLGHTVSTFTGITAGDFSGALAGADALVFPELEIADLAPDLGAPALAAIGSFMSGGGRVIVIGSQFTPGSGTRGANLVNAILGTAFGETEFSTASSSSITAAAVGSPFEGGPASLPNLSGTSGLTGVDAADTIYESGGAASVADFTSGGGLVYIGWDFFDAAPLGPDDPAGWDEVLDRAVGGSAVAAPEPATLALLGLGLAGLGLVRRRKAA